LAHKTYIKQQMARCRFYVSGMRNMLGEPRVSTSERLIHTDNSQ